MTKATKKPLTSAELTTDMALRTAYKLFKIAEAQDGKTSLPEATQSAYDKLHLDRVVTSDCRSWYEKDEFSRLAGLIAYNIQTMRNHLWSIPPSITALVASRMIKLIDSARNAKNKPEHYKPNLAKGQCFGMLFSEVAF